MLILLKEYYVALMQFYIYLFWKSYSQMFEEINMAVL
jgi:hypothetical protein